MSTHYGQVAIEASQPGKFWAVWEAVRTNKALCVGNFLVVGMLGVALSPHADATEQAPNTNTPIGVCKVGQVIPGQAGVCPPRELELPILPINYEKSVHDLGVVTGAGTISYPISLPQGKS